MQRPEGTACVKFIDKSFIDHVLKIHIYKNYI